MSTLIYPCNAEYVDCVSAIRSFPAGNFQIDFAAPPGWGVVKSSDADSTGNHPLGTNEIQNIKRFSVRIFSNWIIPEFNSSEKVQQQIILEIIDKHTITDQIICYSSLYQSSKNILENYCQEKSISFLYIPSASFTPKTFSPNEIKTPIISVLSMCTGCNDSLVAVGIWEALKEKGYNASLYTPLRSLSMYGAKVLPNWLYEHNTSINQRIMQGNKMIYQALDHDPCDIAVIHAGAPMQNINSSLVYDFGESHKVISHIARSDYNILCVPFFEDVHGLYHRLALSFNYGIFSSLDAIYMSNKYINPEKVAEINSLLLERVGVTKINNALRNAEEVPIPCIIGEIDSSSLDKIVFDVIQKMS